MAKDVSSGVPEAHIRLVEIAKKVRAGRSVKPVTVREFLRWFGITRRGDGETTLEIKASLFLLDLQTEPWFEDQNLDGNLRFCEGNRVTEQGTERLDNIVLEMFPPRGKISASEILDHWNIAVDMQILNRRMEIWVAQKTPEEIQQQITGEALATLEDIQATRFTEAELLAARVRVLTVGITETTEWLYAWVQEHGIPKPSTHDRKKMRQMVESARIHRALQRTRPSDDGKVIVGPWRSRFSDLVPEPPFKIRLLQKTASPPISVAPNDPIGKAIDLMSLHGVSQLPVMTGKRDLKGLINWQTIVDTLRRNPDIGMGGEARQYMTNVKALISADTPFLDAIDYVEKHQYALLQEHDKTIIGIVTIDDLSGKLRELTEPFLLLRQIENGLRSLISAAYQPSDLRAAHKDKPEREHGKEGLFDLDFGDYERLLQSESFWNKLGIRREQDLFVRQLSTIRSIRNKIMHFHPDPIDRDGLAALRSFLPFLLESRPEHGLGAPPHQ